MISDCRLKDQFAPNLQSEISNLQSLSPVSYFFGISNRFPTTVQFTTFHHAVM